MDYHLRNTLNFIYFSNHSRDDSITPLWSKEKSYNSFADNPVITRVLANNHIKLKHGNRASYDPESHTIIMPLKEQFPNASQYYFVVFHELAHAVGRENKTQTNVEYAKIARSYDIPKGSTFLDVIRNIATKFDKNEPLTEPERKLYVANTREEFLTDAVAMGLLERAGYKLTPAIKDNVNATAAIAINLSKDYKQDFVAELRDSKTNYNCDFYRIAEPIIKELQVAEKELGITSKNFVKQKAEPKKDRYRER